jgi:hypothetical protein
MLEHIWQWLLPISAEGVMRGRAGIVIGTCLALLVAMGFLILVWRLSGDLQRATVGWAGVLALCLAGLMALAHAGLVYWAAWGLIGLLAAGLAVDVTEFGVGSLGASAFVVPLVLAGCLLGLGPSLVLAGAGTAAIWGLAWAEYTQRFRPRLGRDVSHLTFNAPALTVLYWLVAGLVGAWVDYLVRYSLVGNG